MKRITCSLLVAAIICGFAWLWGFDFNERGDTALLVAYLAVAAGAITYFRPVWNK